MSASTIIFAVNDLDGTALTIALDRTTGRQLWPGGDIEEGSYDAFTGVASRDDLVVARDESGYLVAYDAFDGTFLWGTDCSSSAYLPVIIVASSVAASCSADVSAFNLNSGEKTTLLRETDAVLLGVFERSLVLGHQHDKGFELSVVDLDTGQSAWTYTIPASTGETSIRASTTANGRIFAVVESDTPDAFTLTAVGGTEGPFGAPLPFALNPPTEGAFVKITTETDLRAAPSVEGAPWAALSPGTQVLITGTTEVVDGTTWWQIADPSSGETGWVEPAAFDPAAED